jgi:hypothetical protein
MTISPARSSSTLSQWPCAACRNRTGRSFPGDAVGIRLRDVIGVDNMMWGSDYPHSESTFPQSRKILTEILAGVPEEEQAKIVGGNTARLYGFDVARLAPGGTP